MLTFLAFAFGLAQSQEVADRIAAVVNHDVVTLSEIYDLGGDFIVGRCSGAPAREACVLQAEQEVLDALIKRALVRQELTRLDMTVSGSDVDAAIENIVRDNQLADRRALREEIERSGVGWANYRDQLLEQLRVQRFQQMVLGPRVSITEAELQARYDSMVGSISGELEVRLEAFGVRISDDSEEAEALARELEAAVASINSGELNWDDAVSQYDNVGLSKVIGGSSYRKGELARQVEERVFEADLNTVLEPIRVDRVYFVVRVVSRDVGSGNVKSFDDSKGELQQAVFQEKIAKVEDEWYQISRRQAAIRLLLGPE